jgi:hypothetical protein
MNTPATALGLIRLLLEQGLEAPAELGRPADSARGIPSGLESAAHNLAEMLNDLGLTPPQAREAVKRYLREPNATQFRKPYPDVGMLYARSDLGIAASALGSAADASKAFTDFRSRMRALAFAPSRNHEARHLDRLDPYRNDAMFAALDAMGGAEAWRTQDLSHPATLARVQAEWSAAYLAVRSRQREDRAAIAHTARALQGAQQRALPVAEAK